MKRDYCLFTPDAASLGLYRECCSSAAMQSRSAAPALSPLCVEVRGSDKNAL